MSDPIGFVGLGTMGKPMAGHLLASGANLWVWNRTPGKADGLEAQVANSLEEIATNAKVIILCVNRSEDVAEVVDGLLAGGAKPELIIDHSTISPKAAKDIHDKLKVQGIAFVDAPVTGGSVGAQNGTLTIFCGGDKEDVERAIVIIQPYAKRAANVGESGSGQMTKMANQIAVGGALLALAESLGFAEKAGLDLAMTRELVASGSGGSWAFDNYGPKMLAEDWTPGFSIKNQRKDFGYCIEAATEIGAALPGTELTDKLLGTLHEEGHGEWASAALFEWYTR